VDFEVAATSTTNRPPRRRYDGAGRRERAAQTRVGIVTAATELFIEKGWAGTSMRAIAQRAGVAVETLYASAGSKADLLKLALDIGVVGDDEPIPLAERDAFLAIGADDLDVACRASAAMLSGYYPRVASLLRVATDAAGSDTELASVVALIRDEERRSWTEGIALALGHQPTRTLVDSCRAMFSTDAFLLLTQTSGWTLERYRNWLADALAQVLRPELDHRPSTEEAT
jgi:AcrR family transcriptional regulator